VSNAALRFKPEPGSIPSASGSASAAPVASAEPPPAIGRGGKAIRSDKRTVWLLRGGTPVPVPVQIGLTDGSLTEIVSGELREGDEAITEAIAPEGGGGGGGGGGGNKRPAS
jgi:HlyD family secretion protein